MSGITMSEFKGRFKVSPHNKRNICAYAVSHLPSLCFGEVATSDQPRIGPTTWHDAPSETYPDVRVAAQGTGLSDTQCISLISKATNYQTS
jgi:hypothetical protein